jgi:hypothetical protein
VENGAIKYYLVVERARTFMLQNKYRKCAAAREKKSITKLRQFERNREKNKFPAIANKLLRQNNNSPSLASHHIALSSSFYRESSEIIASTADENCAVSVSVGARGRKTF